MTALPTHAPKPEKCWSCDKYVRCPDCPTPPRSFPDFREYPQRDHPEHDRDIVGRPLRAGR